MSAARRFVIEAAELDALAVEGWIALPKPVYRHALRVLRLDEGAALDLRDGGQRRADAVLARRDGIWGARLVGEVAQVARTAERPVDLVPALFKPQRFRWLLEKAAELGASAVRPVLTERTVIRHTRADDGAWLERHERILREAARQSGALVVPELEAPVTLENRLQELDDKLSILIADPTAENSLSETLADLDPACHLALVTGPEGGLTRDEVERLLERGARAVQLGPRILRAETAPIAMLAALRL